MKKILLAIGLCFLLLGMSAATSMSIPKIKDLNSKIRLNNISSDSEDTPNWAAGNFTGSWGLNIWGGDWFPIGCIEGYYGIGFLWDIKIGRFLIECGGEDGKENGTNLEGIFFGPFLLGNVIDMETGNTSAFVGIGEYNEINFRWRVMAKSGPVLYIKGTFAEFE